MNVIPFRIGFRYFTDVCQPLAAAYFTVLLPKKSGKK